MERRRERRRLPCACTQNTLFPVFIVQYRRPMIGTEENCLPIDALRQFDTCTIANAIERFGVRLRNEGYTQPGLRCVTGGFPCLVGYAATCHVRAADPPVSGPAYLDRTDWWNAIQHLPVPRIAVIQDVEPALVGGIAGEVHAAILRAFHCVGLITNGAVRDLPAVAAMPFPMFAGSVAVSHGYAHMVDYGKPVDIFGLRIHCGDLLMVDVHGAISIPAALADRLPAAAERIRAHEQRIIQVCEDEQFSPDRLLEAIRGGR
jgi:4-hydroxy-4-methyl-2-oxoglutarate aldolase